MGFSGPVTVITIFGIDGVVSILNICVVLENYHLDYVTIFSSIYIC